MTTVTATGIAELEMSDIKASGLTALIGTMSSTQPITARLSNTTVAATNLVTASCPVTLEMANVDVNTSGAIIAVTGANATPIRVLASNFKQSGAGAGMSRDGTQSLSVNGRSFLVDLSILTPTDQDMANNSNGALACGTGTAIFHTGGTGNGWKNLYSGTTY